MMSTVLVTGATGVVGGHVVRELRSRAVPARAFVRDPAKAADALGAGVELAAGDFGDRASIRRALDGVERVLLCSPNSARQVEHEQNVIDAAVDAGVTRLVKIGAIGSQIGSPLAFWDAHGRIEQHLQACGLPWVGLHPSTYTSNLFAAADSVRELGLLLAPAGDAKVALIDPRDVAAVAAVVLAEDGHDGRTYTLTGPEALTYVEVAEQLSAAIARPVTYVNVSDRDAREGMTQAGLPEWLADQLLILWSLLRGGAAATTTDVVRVLTGREPRSVTDFGRDFGAAFR
jgi:uncharacterized protein YbjT (DUF2867 family)